MDACHMSGPHFLSQLTRTRLLDAFADVTTSLQALLPVCLSCALSMQTFIAPLKLAE